MQLYLVLYLCMDKIILFDIDITLIDSDIMDGLVEQRFSEISGTSLNKIKETDAAYFKTIESTKDFDIWEYSSFYGKTFNKNMQTYLDVFLEADIYKKCLYPDTISSLEKLSRSHTLGIFSEGFDYFQLLKLESAGLIDFFDEKLIHIYRRKCTEEALSELPDKCTIVDDSVRVINYLISHNQKQFQIYWMRGAQPDENFPVKKILNLTEFSNLHL